MSHTFKAGLSATPEIGEALARIERALNDAQPDFTYQSRAVAPTKTWNGLTAYANGTNWNPGSGPGLYLHNGTAWSLVGPYLTGSGGAVTQATSKATGVTLNKPCGEITMNAANLAAGTVVSFTLTDSSIGSKDVLVMNHVSGGTLGVYGLNAACSSGSAVVYVRNNTAGVLGEAIVIRFAVFKAAAS